MVKTGQNAGSHSALSRLFAVWSLKGQSNQRRNHFLSICLVLASSKPHPVIICNTNCLEETVFLFVNEMFFKITSDDFI